jgi:hypothetical protein
VDPRAGLDTYFPPFSILLLVPAAPLSISELLPSSLVLTEKGEKYENINVLLYVL